MLCKVMYMSVCQASHFQGAFYKYILCHMERARLTLGAISAVSSTYYSSIAGPD